MTDLYYIVFGRRQRLHGLKHLTVLHDVKRNNPFGGRRVFAPVGGGRFLLPALKCTLMYENRHQVYKRWIGEYRIYTRGCERIHRR